MAGFLLCLPAAAQQLCLPHAEAISRLQQYHGETAKGLGLGHRGASVIEVFTNATTGSWTILVTRTNGLSCIAASGEDWTTLEGELTEEETPA